MLPTDRLDYHLPDELIATHPAEPRDASRLMVVSRSDPSRLEHRVFRDLPEYLRPEDVIVRNRSAVLPARLAGTRADSAGRIEGLFLTEPEPGVWIAMLRSNGKLRAGTRIALHAPSDPTADANVHLTIDSRAEDGWRLRVTDTDDRPLTEGAPAILARVGATPLPPYILAARKRHADATPDERDRADYQTVYASADDPRSVAAPTAGLHFTPGLLDTIAAMGVRTHDVTLHVGAGTFTPVTADTIEAHDMHEELMHVEAETTRAITDARARGGRSVVVGTTTVRALESVPDNAEAFAGPTDLLITPGFTFRRTDALITNFHLPRSTLLAMVGALFQGDDPVGRLLDCYREAVRERYRFYSFGDAMLILP